MRRFLAMGRNDQDAVRECTRGEPALYVSVWHGEALEFDYVGEALDQERWLKSQVDSVLIPSSVSRRNVSFASAGIPDEYADLYSFTALSWDDFRMAVRTAVSEGASRAQHQK
jgi:hypothetical protein